MKRALLSDEDRTERVQRKVSQFHSGTIEEVSKAVEDSPLVIVGMAQNPIVAKARRALEEANLEFTYLEYGSYLSQWKPRLAIKMWSGWPTFPQVFANGTLVGGNHELRKMLEDGSLRSMLDETSNN